jgi:hypothetical protein
MVVVASDSRKTLRLPRFARMVRAAYRDTAPLARATPNRAAYNQPPRGPYDQCRDKTCSRSKLVSAYNLVER